MNKRVEMYKYEWLVPKNVPDTAQVILEHCPDKLYSFRLHDYGDDLKVVAIETDVPEYNCNSKITLLSYVDTVLSCLPKIYTIPKWMCVKPTGDILAYCQPSIEILTKVYEPLMHSLAKKAHLTLERYFAYGDLVQQAYLTLVDLRHRGYYVSANLIKRAYFNELYMQLRKLPTRHIVISFDEPTNDKNGDDAVTTILDTIADIDDKFDNILEDIDLIRNRKRVINVIGSRQYDQLLREFKNNQTTNATRVKINKLKKRFNND